MDHISPFSLPPSVNLQDPINNKMQICNIGIRRSRIHLDLKLSILAAQNLAEEKRIIITGHIVSFDLFLAYLGLSGGLDEETKSIVAGGLGVHYCARYAEDVFSLVYLQGVYLFFIRICIGCAHLGMHSCAIGLETVQSSAHLINLSLHASEAQFLDTVLELNILQPNLLPKLGQEIKIDHKNNLQGLLPIINKLLKLASEMFLTLFLKRRQHRILVNPHQLYSIITEMLVSGQEFGRHW